MDVKILWDFNIVADKMIEVRRPDIDADKKNSKTDIFVVRSDVRVGEKETEKSQTEKKSKRDERGQCDQEAPQEDAQAQAAQAFEAAASQAEALDRLVVSRRAVEAFHPHPLESSLFAKPFYRSRICAPWARHLRDSCALSPGARVASILLRGLLTRAAW